MCGQDRRERNWKKTFETFLSSDYDCAGWLCDSKGQAKSIIVSGSKSIHRPENVRLFRRGAAAYMIRDGVDALCESRTPESVADTLPWHIMSFVTSDYDFAGILLKSREDAASLLRFSESSCCGMRLMSSMTKDRALWHYKPRFDEEVGGDPDQEIPRGVTSQPA